MELFYKDELVPRLNQSREEILNYAAELINSNNANNRQRVNELSFLLRKSQTPALRSVAVDISRMMFETAPTVSNLNLYFVAVVDNADISEVQKMDHMVSEYLQTNGLPYQKHLYATWLKGANLILDDDMFERIYADVPSTEKTENPYIISQFYVYKNRHTLYKEVVDHYATLKPNIQNQRYVRQYYINACSRLGIGTGRTSIVKPVATTTTPSPSSDSEKKVFIVYGNDPVNLSVIKSLLKASNIPFVDLKEQANNGKTIIEKFESEASSTNYALIMCTPENKGENNIWYPRQNVIFEWGYFTGKLGRKNVCLLYQENGKTMDLPSDTHGIVYISLDKGSWTDEFRTSLSNAGFNPTF